VPDQVKPSFVIFDIRALLRSDSCTNMATVGIKGLTFDRHVYFFLEVEECPVGCDHEYKRVKNTPKWSLISLGHILTYDVTLILTFYQTLACFIAEYSSVVSIKSFHGYCGVYKLRTQKHRV